MFISGSGGFGGLGLNEHKNRGTLPSLLRADLTSRLVRPSRAQASRGSCWERQQMAVVIGLANLAGRLSLSLLPLCVPTIFSAWGQVGTGKS